MTSPAFAHRDDYLNETFVFQTLEAGEFEPELLVDHAPRSDGREPFQLYGVAFEYGVTKHWMVDAFAGWLDPANRGPEFRRFRAETRVRFGEEGERAVDVAASFEVEYERAPASGADAEQEYALTPRLVLSRDLGADFNITLNLDLSLELHPHHSGRWKPGYAVAFRYPREALLRYGAEVRQDFGEERESLLVPQIWISLPHDATFKLGGGVDLDGPARQHFWRMVFEIEF